MAKQKHDTSNIDNLLASVTADMLGDGFSEPLADNSIRVERFLLGAGKTCQAIYCKIRKTCYRYCFSM